MISIKRMELKILDLTTIDEVFEYAKNILLNPTYEEVEEVSFVFNDEMWYIKRHKILEV